MLVRTLGVGLIFASFLPGCGSDETRASVDGGSGSAGAGGSGGSGGAGGTTGSGASTGSGGSSGRGGSTGGVSGASDGATSDGSGGALGADDGSAHDAGSDAALAVDCVASPQVFPTFDRACWDDLWCSVLFHQIDCCGNLKALGMLHPELERLASSEQLCKSQYPACDCAGGTITTDTGQTATDGSQVKVQCRSGLCTTYVP
jgi:hypothetical protein